MKFGDFRAQNTWSYLAKHIEGTRKSGSALGHDTGRYWSKKQNSWDTSYCILKLMGAWIEAKVQETGKDQGFRYTTFQHGDCEWAMQAKTFGIPTGSRNISQSGTSGFVVILTTSRFVPSAVTTMYHLEKWPYSIWRKRKEWLQNDEGVDETYHTSWMVFHLSFLGFGLEILEKTGCDIV